MKQEEVTVTLDAQVVDALQPDVDGWEARPGAAIRNGLRALDSSAICHDAFVGVDGCRGGWLAVSYDDDPAKATLHHAEGFADLLAMLPEATIAVDMPIGLPERITKGGRGPEQSIRPLLGERRSSVFSIPSRRAVMCEEYRDACSVALDTSDPPRKVSKQGFHLFPKIRELDALMTPALQARVFEAHPELAFWRLNSEQPVAEPKKIKGRVSPDGMAARKALLLREGYIEGFLDAPLPRGAGRDDLLDAAVLTLLANRIVDGRATPFPQDFQRDACGLRVAIWA